MTEREQPKPIFGFLWPSDNRVSLEQIRFLRVGKRGAIRLVTLLALTLMLTFFSVSSLAYLFNARPRILETLLISLLLATTSVVVFRAWTLGTYVNDRGIKIVNLFKTKAIKWDSIKGIEIGITRWSALGISLPLKTNHVLVHLESGKDIRTHLYLGSVDGIFTHDQLETRHLLILRWFRSE